MGFLYNGFLFNQITGGLELSQNVTTPYTGSVIIPSYVPSYGNVIKIADPAFQNSATLKGLTSVFIPDTVTTTGITFTNCAQLTSVRWSEACASVTARTFKDCSKLAEITIPACVTYLGVQAFSGCSSLKKVYFYGNKPSLGDYTTVFEFTPSDRLNYYKYGTTGWSPYVNGIGNMTEFGRPSSGLLISAQF